MDWFFMQIAKLFFWNANCQAIFLTQIAKPGVAMCSLAHGVCLLQNQTSHGRPSSLHMPRLLAVRSIFLFISWSGHLALPRLFRALNSLEWLSICQSNLDIFSLRKKIRCKLSWKSPGPIKYFYHTFFILGQFRSSITFFEHLALG
jgi:hypothetical protein